uniref:DUF1499 domain-containing protein n=1 Tax=Marinobacterium profundum TaxID=1714300 RepID=UPI00082B7583|nr:DUF1499 domain-containing protein [Marinobacterium profundum]
MVNSSSRFGSVLLFIAIFALLGVVLTMFGARFGLWEPIVGFGLIRTYLNPVGYGVISLGALGLVYQLVTRNSAGAVKAAAASLIGVGLLAPMIYGSIQPAKQFPPIHDITTDTSHPPVFRVLDDSRAGARNSLVYGGPEIAAEQRKAYPDIAPIQSSKPASEAFAEALRVAKAMGWEIVAQDPSEMRLEATARTSVYGFMDDVVVVVTPVDSASRVDIRSVSRIGRGDRGVNAARIRAFIKAFEGE